MLGITIYTQNNKVYEQKCFPIPVVLVVVVSTVSEILGWKNLLPQGSSLSIRISSSIIFP